MIQVRYQAPLDQHIFAKIQQERELIQWCNEQFPDGNWQVYSDWVYFENKKDAIMFALRWA